MATNNCVAKALNFLLQLQLVNSPILQGARCSPMVRVFAHGAMGRQIDPSWGGPIELFLVPASVPRLVCVILSVGWCI